MDLVREFFRDKTAAHRLMIVAFLLLGVSQFFPYMDDQVLAWWRTDGTWIWNYHHNGVPPGTGWELHPHAYAVLVILAFAYLKDDITTSPLFSRWGWWVTVGLFVAAVVPGAPMRTTGAAMGGIAVLLALAAAFLHRAEAARAARARAVADAAPRAPGA